MQHCFSDGRSTAEGEGSVAVSPNERWREGHASEVIYRDFSNKTVELRFLAGMGQTESTGFRIRRRISTFSAFHPQKRDPKRGDSANRGSVHDATAIQPYGDGAEGNGRSAVLSAYSAWQLKAGWSQRLYEGVCSPEHLRQD